jgi:penicillin-binding protein 1C
MKQKVWFVLPPALEIYYKHKDPSYKALPPYSKGCTPDVSKTMEFIYPNEGATLFLPINMDQTREKVIFKIAHNNSNSHLYWHLDGYYLGQTTGTHEMELEPDIGKHTLVVVDEEGVRITRHFTIIEK